MSNRSAGTGIGALLIGLAIGATAVYLSDENNRKKTAKAINDLTQSAVDFAHQVQEDPQAVAESIKKSAAELASAASDSAKKSGKQIAEASKVATTKAIESAEKSLATAKEKLADEKPVKA